MKKQGSTMLKVCGILMIIFGAIGLISDIAIMSEITGYSSFLPGSVNVGLIFLIGAVVVELIAGILGVVNWAKPSGAGICIIFGILMIACIVLGDILTVVGINSLTGSYSRYFDGFNTVIVISGLINLVLPILYLIGAFKLKKMPAQPAGYGYPQNGYNPYMQNNYQQGTVQSNTGQGSFGQNTYNPGRYVQNPYTQQTQNPYANQAQNYGTQNPYANQAYNQSGRSPMPYGNQAQNNAMPYDNQQAAPQMPYGSQSAPDQNNGDGTTAQ